MRTPSLVLYNRLGMICDARVEESMALQIKYEKKTRYPGITEIGPLKYRIRVRLVDPKTGRRRQRIRAFEGTLAEAAVEQARLRSEETEATQKARLRLVDFATLWLEHKAVSVSHSTGERLAWEIGFHVVPVLGDFWVDAVSAADMRQWQAGRLAQGLAPATVNSVHRALRGLFDAAVADQLVASNPARVVPTLREGRTKGPRGTVLSAEQLGALLTTGRQMTRSGEVAGDLYGMIVMLGLCGLRFGELSAAEWRDLQGSFLHVERAQWRGHVKTTKTDDPRIVALPELVREELEAQRARLGETDHPALDSGLMFPGNPMQVLAGATRRGTEDPNWYRYPSCLTKPLKKITSAAGLPRISPHSLRRTWENVMRQAGVDQMVRRAMGGWRTERAQAIYSQVDLAEACRAAEQAAATVMGNT
jgi:integrase